VQGDAERTFPDLAPEQLRIVGDPAWRGRDNDSSEHDWGWHSSRRWDTGRAKPRATSRGCAMRQSGRRWSSMMAMPSTLLQHLIRGHLGGYRYRDADLKDGETRGHLEVADTIYTHVCDAEQYLHSKAIT
jgi:hypothetical protein